MGPIITGVSFRDASLDLRERLTLPLSDTESHHKAFLRQPEIEECALLGTCNRMEIFVGPNPDFDLDEVLAAVHRVWLDLLGSDLNIRQYVRSWSGEDAVHHAFRIMASLDSLVVGEAQILGQVKESYRRSVQFDGMGPQLRSLFEYGFKVAKEIRTETSIGKESVSISSVAVELARQIFDPIEEVNVLLVGAGKMAVLAGKYLEDAGARCVTVVNRTFSRAERLASERSWDARRFEDLDLLLPEADVVITSTGAQRPIITREMVNAVMQRRRFRPLFFIDISVPRDVETSVTEVDRTYLYNIDDLEGIANRNLSARESDLTLADEILARGIQSYEKRENVIRRKPLLSRVTGYAERIRDEELMRATNRLGESDDRMKKILAQMAHKITQRLTRGTYKVIKDLDERDLDRLSPFVEDMYSVGADVDLDDEDSDSDHEQEAS